MAGTLTTTIFLKFQEKFKDRCATLFVEAYYTSISNKSIFLDFDENDITAILHNHIDENPKRKSWKISTNLENYLFDKEATLIKGFAAKFSRIDMRYTTFWKGEEYKYFVEVKNLKANDSGLKRRYITTGIDNFLIGGKYFECEGFLIGYILEGTFDNCVEGINKLLLKDKRGKETIYKSSAFSSFDSHFSNHNRKGLLHLFLDFAN
jgi:Fe-S cluster biosynthesis and repair protein YggX